MVYRMERVSFSFDGPAFPVFGKKAAASRAFPAGGGIPGGFTRDNIFRGEDERDSIPGGFRGTTHGRGSSRQSNHLQEFAARDITHFITPLKIIKKQKGGFNL